MHVGYDAGMGRPALNQSLSLNRGPSRFRLKVNVGTALGVSVLSLGSRSQRTFSEVKPLIDP